MKNNPLYNYIVDKHRFKDERRYTLKKSQSSVDFVMYQLGRVRGDVCLSKELLPTAVIKEHHISVYKDYNDKSIYCSQYHYTAVLSDEALDNHYILHVYFSAKDTVIGCTLQLELGDKVEVNLIFSGNAKQWAMSQIGSVMNTWRRGQSSHILALRQSYAEKIMRLEQLDSAESHDDWRRYLSELLIWMEEQKVVLMDAEYFNAPARFLQRECEAPIEELPVIAHITSDSSAHEVLGEVAPDQAVTPLPVVDVSPEELIAKAIGAMEVFKVNVDNVDCYLEAFNTLVDAEQCSLNQNQSSTIARLDIECKALMQKLESKLLYKGDLAAAKEVITHRYSSGFLEQGVIGALSDAVCHGAADTVKFILDHYPIQTNTFKIKKRSPLAICAEKVLGQPAAEVIKFKACFKSLVEYGFDLLAPDQKLTVALNMLGNISHPFFGLMIDILLDEQLELLIDIIEKGGDLGPRKEEIVINSVALKARLCFCVSKVVQTQTQGFLKIAGEIISSDMLEDLWKDIDFIKHMLEHNQLLAHHVKGFSKEEQVSCVRNAKSMMQGKSLSEVFDISNVENLKKLIRASNKFTISTLHEGIQALRLHKDLKHYQKPVRLKAIEAELQKIEDHIIEKSQEFQLEISGLLKDPLLKMTLQLQKISVGFLEQVQVQVISQQEIEAEDLSQALSGLGSFFEELVDAMDGSEVVEGTSEPSTRRAP